MSQICRTCLQPVDKSRYFYIDTFDNTEIANTIPKEVLQLCVPELDLYISQHPGVCGDCLHMFENFYNFKNRCLTSEEKILSYLQKYRIGPQQRVNLTCVVDDIAETPYIWLNSTNNGEPVREQDISDDIEGVFRLNDNNAEIVVINLNKNASSSCDDKNVLLLSCNKCSYVTMDQSKLAEHNCVAVFTSDKYKCPYCDYSSGRRQRLTHHINAKHTKSVVHDCDRCDFKTTDAGSMRRHKKVVHQFVAVSEVRTYSCNGCDFISLTELGLQRHRVAAHGPPMQYCTFCPYQTKDKSNFRKHLFIHSDKPKKCTLCNYQCVSPYQLTKHHKKFH